MYHTSERVIKNKVGLLNLAEELGNISKACKVMGFSRETFYRYQRAVSEGGVENLLDKSRRQPNTKNRVDEAVEVAVNSIAARHGWRVVPGSRVGGARSLSKNKLNNWCLEEQRSKRYVLSCSIYLRQVLAHTHMRRPVIWKPFGMRKLDLL
jgi:hypothetical protein